MRQPAPVGRRESPEAFRAATIAAGSGLGLFGAGFAMNLFGSIRCAFGDGPCGQGLVLVAAGAIAFVVCGGVLFRAGRAWQALALIVSGILSAAMMRASWTSSGHGIAVAWVPAILATVWLFASARGWAGSASRPDTAGSDDRPLQEGDLVEWIGPVMGRGLPYPGERGVLSEMRETDDVVIWDVCGRLTGEFTREPGLIMRIGDANGPPPDEGLSHDPVDPT